ncbi:MAG TPA: cell division protein SepF [Candidatus Nanoarchaeia archaeon]|nr:cell division protein SepF [Candidatus Nanoarchaeia archaeon]
MVFDTLKKFLSRDDISGEEYLEIDLGQERRDKKVLVKLFNLRQYDDVNNILDALREGYTIAIIDMKTIRQKDAIELKRAISKVKKTVEALEGTIAGFGENVIIATPSFATIHKEEEKVVSEKANKFDFE